jgi:DNA gyrase subunit A
MVTRRGIIKRIALREFRNVRKNGVIALRMDDNDELAWVRLTSGNDELIIATREGMAIRFNENDARPLSRVARGVKAIALGKEDDEVVGVDVFVPGKTVLTVTETGFGRRSEPENYRLQSRGGKGVTNYHCHRFGKVAAVAVVAEEEDLILISSDGILIRIPAAQISHSNRPAKGVRVMKTAENERVVTMANVPATGDDEPTETEEATA